MSYIAGIDPGLNGAICLYMPRLVKPEPIVIFDMPTLEVTRNRKTRRQIDLYALGRWVDMNAELITKAYIENPQGMPGMSGHSQHQLGENVGIAKMVIAANFIAMELIAPATWKKAMKVGKNKDESRLRASQIAPHEGHHWARVKDDGRAEAFLIAKYGESLE